MANNPLKVSQKFTVNGQILQIVAGNGNRVNASVTAVSTTEAALPTNGGLLIVRAPEAVWLRFGATGVGAASAAATSVLFVGGEAPVPVPAGATHFRALIFGVDNFAIQLEGVDAT